MNPRGFPETLPEFQKVFPTEEACADYLEKLRWPDGFACPKCGVAAEPWRLAKPGVLKCSSCRADISLTAGTVMHSTHSELTTWFWAAYLVTTQTPGMSALQFQRQMGLKRYETSYMLLQKLRSGMVRPERDVIGTEHPVEVDETLVGGRTKGKGRGVHEKVYVIGAVEVRTRRQCEGRSSPSGVAHSEGKPLKKRIYAGRLRLQMTDDRKAATCEGFVRDHVAPGARVRTDGWQGYDGLTRQGWSHDGLALNADAELTNEHLPLIHLVFSNLKAWINGTHHGRIEPKHLQAYLNEFVFRFNRRFYPMTSFNSVLGLAVRTVPPTYARLYSGVWQHPGSPPKAPQIEIPFQ